MDIFTRDDLVQDGITEDGETNYTRHYYVIAELDDGTRYGHYHTSTDRDSVEALAGKVSEAVVGKGIDALNLDHWSSIDPRYGSEAHQHIGDRHLMTDRELENNQRAGYMN